MTKLDSYLKTMSDLEQSFNIRKLPQTLNNLIDLSSNDYLGINSNLDLRNEFLENIELEKYQFSASSSRLLSGNSVEYKTLEGIIATAYKRDACLIFNSGYHANIGILPALAQRNDLILADKLVHASIIDGLKLSDAKIFRFRHLDYEHLLNLLNKHRSQYNNVFIVSESIFSMDGDEANLKQLVEIKELYNCFLYIDEAHSVGARGMNGLGLAEEQDLLDKIDFIVGTFGKALASIGAFLVCNNLFKQYLVNKSRSLIYTTALPSLNIAWSIFIFDMLPNLKEQRNNLRKISSEFSKVLNSQSKSHIIPYIVGSNNKAISASENLRKIGYNVLPIRYPTVPKGMARLRFSLRANLTINELQPLLNSIE